LLVLVIGLEWKLVAKFVVCLNPKAPNAEAPTAQEGGVRGEEETDGRRGRGGNDGGENSDNGDKRQRRRLPSEDEDGGSGNGVSDCSVVTPVVLIAVVVAIGMSIVTPAVVVAVGSGI
jgi:hypothetical protein